jgi:hypothetical protein
MTADGVVFVTFHTPAKELCHRVGRWLDQAGLGFTGRKITFVHSPHEVCWKPFSEANHLGSGQKSTIAISGNPLQQLTVVVCYQGGTDKDALYFKIGSYSMSQ